MEISTEDDESQILVFVPIACFNATFQLGVITHPYEVLRNNTERSHVPLPSFPRWQHLAEPARSAMAEAWTAAHPTDATHRVDSAARSLATSAGAHAHRREAPGRFRRLEDPSRRPFVAVPTLSPQPPKHTPNFGGH